MYEDVYTRFYKEDGKYLIGVNYSSRLSWLDITKIFIKVKSEIILDQAVEPDRIYDQYKIYERVLFVIDRDVLDRIKTTDFSGHDYSLNQKELKKIQVSLYQPPTNSKKFAVK